jgi:hypothetical protein
MKTFWSWLVKILLVIAVVEAWFLYDFYQKNQSLISENIELETQLLISQEALTEANKRVEQLEKQSLEGVLKQTNKAVVSGWEKLMNTVEEELKKARDALPTIIGEPEASVTPSESEVKPENGETRQQNKAETESIDSHNQTGSKDQKEKEEKPVESPIKGERT